MNESNQIIELLNNENTTFKSISYKSVNRTKIYNTNNNSFSINRIRFNAKELADHLVSYEDAYILYEVDIKLIMYIIQILYLIYLKIQKVMIYYIKV